MLKSILSSGLLAIVSAIQVSGQSVVNAAGGSLASGNERLDYAIGEIATATVSNLQNHLTQGVLQPMTVLVGTNEPFDQKFAFLAYPNPVGSQLSIKTDYEGFQSLEILDISGKNLLSQDWDGRPIDFQTFPAGTYIVRLHDAQFVKTIKIIKQ